MVIVIVLLTVACLVLLLELLVAHSQIQHLTNLNRDLLNQQKQDWKAEARVLAAPHVEEAMLFPYHRPYLVPDLIEHEPTDAMWLDAFAGTDILVRGDN